MSLSIVCNDLLVRRLPSKKKEKKKKKKKKKKKRRKSKRRKKETEFSYTVHSVFPRRLGQG